MTDQRQQGPRSLHLWIEDNGKIAGLEWHCPPGQCQSYQDGPCPHAVLPKQGGGPLVCNNMERCKHSMMEWAEKTFCDFARLFRERAA